MNRQQKEHVIQELKHEFRESEASFLVGYQGMTVAQLLDLRRKLQSKNSVMQVAKVTLMQRAIQDDVGELVPYLSHQVALVFARNESPAVAKILSDFFGKSEKGNIVAGCFEGSVLTAEQVKAFASLPSRDVLLAQLCGGLKAPVAKLPFVLKLLIMRLVFVLQEMSKKKEA